MLQSVWITECSLNCACSYVHVDAFTVADALAKATYKRRTKTKETGDFLWKLVTATDLQNVLS